MTDKRRFHRIHFTVDADLKIGNDSWDVRVLDLSLNGALISFTEDCPLIKNLNCTLTFPLQDDESIIKMNVSVKHLMRDHAGLCIHHIDVDSLSHLKRIIELNTGDPSILERELHDLVELHLSEQTG